MYETKVTCDECGNIITGTYFNLVSHNSWLPQKDLCPTCAITYANKVINEGYNPKTEHIQELMKEHKDLMSRLNKKRKDR